MTSNILTINFEIPGHSFAHNGYFSDQSLLDADIVVFQPEKFHDGYNESDSAQVMRQTRHWHQEISTALEAGKTVFVLLGKHVTTKVYTGRSELKGSKVVNYVDHIDNYGFLPIQVPTIISKRGTEIVFTGHSSFASFWKEFEEYLTYESYLNGSIKTPIFVTTTGARPVGGLFKVGKGSLVLLPMIDYDRGEFITRDKKGEQIWTKPAIQFGDQLVSALVAIDKSLRIGAQRTPPPQWISNGEFTLATELDLTEQIQKVDSRIASLETKKSELATSLASAVELKGLLFETGKPLERAVSQALTLLGYTAENYDDGTLELDHVVISPEGERFIGECEGKDNNAINIDKFRQLEENIQSDLQREEVTEPATGILFGNGYRLSEPKARLEQFTAKCLASAKRGTILIRTADLFPIARYLQEHNDKDFAEACRKVISAGRGQIVTFPSVPR